MSRASPLPLALHHRIRLLLPGIVLVILSTLATAKEITEGEKLFALKLKPLFAEKCLACHGDDPGKLKGGFDLRDRQSAIKGGDTFGREVLIPRKGKESFLYRVTARLEKDYEMPPKEADRLSQEQAWWVRDWINAGAPWPDDERVALIEEKHAEGRLVPTSKALSEAWQNRRYDPASLWAYHPLKETRVPEGVHPVDHFIDHSLEKAGLAPAPPAQARELGRRLSFGLTGLPPKPQALSDFARSHRTDPGTAILTFTNQLMNSAHFGEHFGRHWLDVARYADSAGFANDYTRPHAWRYRDYVVRAFNEDKPYPEFVRQQIAGDELDDQDPENLIATGFLRMGPWEQTAMSVFKETRQLWLDDVTDSVGQTFLGHALQCAKCHAHKFDPIPTRDYYRMMAVFSTTQFADREAAFLPSESRRHFSKSDEWVRAKVDSYQTQKKALEEAVRKRRKKETGKAKTGDNGLDPGDEASLARMNKNILRHQWEKDRTRPVAFSVYTGKTVNRNSVRGPIAMAAEPWKQGFIEKDTILTGGSAYAPGDAVTPGALSAVESLSTLTPSRFPNARGKRRLALADWITDTKNPLTARVMVNRVWAWHFGKGLAGNPNNFGATGLPPTHPELLDYLAQWYMDHGWSTKKLSQLIVTSTAYQRSSRHPDPDAVADRDPKSTLYAQFQPRRLTAEELRDAMLVASGELNGEVGGIPARPDINLEVAYQPRQIMGGTASVYEPDSNPEQRNRRSLYAEKSRGVRDPFLETFNQPGADDSCELRETSTVAPQALTLLNAEEVQDRSLAFAARLLKEERDETATIARAFDLALGRPPTPEEIEACLNQWTVATNEEEKVQPKPRRFPDRITRTVMAEKTGEPYDFVEHLPTYTDYVPDLQRSDVDARTRALAHVCLVLFNLNEFAYVD
ncbi:MAG: PSD1 and planctomycete cytochrome C domain-containing protein [Verrucomicrobiota bacterium]